jgi:hypothetical protein
MNDQVDGLPNLPVRDALRHFTYQVFQAAEAFRRAVA